MLLDVPSTEMSAWPAKGIIVRSSINIFSSFELWLESIVPNGILISVQGGVSAHGRPSSKADSSADALRPLKHPHPTAERFVVWVEQARSSGRIERADKLLGLAWEAYDRPARAHSQRRAVQPPLRRADNKPRLTGADYQNSTMRTGHFRCHRERSVAIQAGPPSDRVRSLNCFAAKSSSQ